MERVKSLRDVPKDYKRKLSLSNMLSKITQINKKSVSVKPIPESNKKEVASPSSLPVFKKPLRIQPTVNISDIRLEPETKTRTFYKTLIILYRKNVQVIKWLSKQNIYIASIMFIIAFNLASKGGWF